MRLTLAFILRLFPVCGFSWGGRFLLFTTIDLWTFWFRSGCPFLMLGHHSCQFSTTDTRYGKHCDFYANYVTLVIFLLKCNNLPNLQFVQLVWGWQFHFRTLYYPKLDKLSKKKNKKFKFYHTSYYFLCVFAEKLTYCACCCLVLSSTFALIMRNLIKFRDLHFNRRILNFQ